MIKTGYKDGLIAARLMNRYRDDRGRWAGARDLDQCGQIFINRSLTGAGNMHTDTRLAHVEVRVPAPLFLIEG
jgi:hypothetical protein